VPTACGVTPLPFPTTILPITRRHWRAVPEGEQAERGAGSPGGCLPPGFQLASDPTAPDAGRAEGKRLRQGDQSGNPLEIKNRATGNCCAAGWAYYGSEKYEDALRFFERMRMEDPKRVEVLNLLADIYYRLDQQDKSREDCSSPCTETGPEGLDELKQKLELQ